MFRELHLIFLAAGVALVAVFSGNSEAGFLVTDVGGDSTPGSIQSAVDSFRNADVLGAIPKPDGSALW